MGILARDGCELTPRAEEAEVLVVNTCSFIEAAQKESVDAILEMAEHKKFGAAKKLIVAGCLVERYREQILEQVPEVDAVVGTGEVERILEAVHGDLRMLPAEPPMFLYHDFTPRMVTTPKHTAYLKIGHDLLRRRPGPARRPGAIACETCSSKRFALGALPLCLSQSHNARIAGHDRGASAAGQLH